MTFSKAALFWHGDSLCNLADWACTQHAAQADLELEAFLAWLFQPSAPDLRCGEPGTTVVSVGGDDAPYMVRLCVCEDPSLDHQPPPPTMHTHAGVRTCSCDFGAGEHTACRGAILTKRAEFWSQKLNRRKDWGCYPDTLDLCVGLSAHTQKSHYWDLRLLCATSVVCCGNERYVFLFKFVE